MNKLLLLCATALTVAACGRPPQQGSWLDEGINLFNKNVPGSSVVTVIDENGKPVANAQVMVGSSINQPFAGNILVTDAAGKFKAPANWTNEQPVTINAPDFVRATYLEQKPTGQTFAIRRKIKATELELSGNTTGHKIKDMDGFVDFAVVVPTIQKSQFFNFDVTQFISPYSDTISIVGRSVNVPSNISLPKQTESYFIPITLNKPRYRSIFKTPGAKTVFAMRGRFPLEDVVNEARGGGDFTKLTRFFDIGGGSLRDVNLSKNTTLDIPVTEINFTKKVGVKGPALSSDELVLSVALAQHKNTFYPSDIKALEPNKTLQMNQVGTTSQLLSVLKKNDEVKPGSPNFDRLSASFLPLANGMTPTFLALMDTPRVNNAYSISIGAVTLPNGLFEGATYLVLSKVEQVELSGQKIDLLENHWEVFGPKWTRNVAIPQWPNDVMPAGNLRWEVTVSAVPNKNALTNVPLGPKWLESASHATRASSDL